MCIFRYFSAPVACLLVAVMVWVSLPHRAAFAGLVGTETVLSGEAGALDDRARVRNFMLRQDVQAKVASYGVDPAEALARVEGLTDREVAMLATRIDELPEGQSGGIATAGAVVIVLYLLLLIGLVVAGIVGLVILIKNAGTAPTVATAPLGDETRE
jgi:hypothetical protein